MHKAIHTRTETLKLRSFNRLTRILPRNRYRSGFHRTRMNFEPNPKWTSCFKSKQLFSSDDDNGAEGVNRILELIGTVTLLDSVQPAVPKGIVCNMGIPGNEWTIKNFEPLVDIPSTVKLPVYNSETITAANSTKALEHVVEGIVNGRYHVNLDWVFRFEEIVEAHRYVEANKAKGKLVVKIE